MGYAYGHARRARTQGHALASSLLNLCALLVPLLCHGLYDYLATSGDDAFFAYLVAFVAVGMLVARHAARKAQRVGR